VDEWIQVTYSSSSGKFAVDGVSQVSHGEASIAALRVPRATTQGTMALERYKTYKIKGARNVNHPVNIATTSTGGMMGANAYNGMYLCVCPGHKVIVVVAPFTS
jgi:hypothetical protein